MSETTNQPPQPATQPAADPEPRPPRQAPSPQEFSPSALDRFMRKRSTPISDGGPPPERRRRRVNITIMPDMCAPDTFDQPFKLGVVELSSGEEIVAYREAGTVSSGGGSQEALAAALGRHATKFFNGRRMSPEEQTEVWEALGMTGRLAVGMAYLAHCTGADQADSLKNSVAAIEIE